MAQTMIVEYEAKTTAVRPRECTEWHPGSCAACALAEAHVHGLDHGSEVRLGARIATFYGARAVERARQYAREHGTHYPDGLVVVYDEAMWEEEEEL